VLRKRYSPVPLVLSCVAIAAVAVLWPQHHAVNHQVASLSASPSPELLTAAMRDYRADSRVARAQIENVRRAENVYYKSHTDSDYRVMMAERHLSMCAQGFARDDMLDYDAIAKSLMESGKLPTGFPSKLD